MTLTRTLLITGAFGAVGLFFHHLNESRPEAIAAAAARRAEDADQDERQQAARAAKDAVRARLKAPDTAEFTGTKTARYAGALVAFGTVTAKNPLGVPLRHAWRAEVEPGTFAVRKLTIE